MLGCHIPCHHIFLVVNLPNFEVEALHKFEQAIPYARRIACLELNTLVREGK